MKFNYRETLTINDFKNQFNSNDKIEKIKKIARNTFEYIINGEKRIRFYETDIVIFKSYYLILNNDGFNAKITMSKINDILSNSYIYIKKGIWYYTKYNENMRDNTIGDIRFFDGIKIHLKSGKVLNKSKAPKIKNSDKKRKRILKQIKAYTDKINKMKNLPSNHLGDCFFCQMDSFKGKDHLLVHLKGKYIMKSLIYRALIKEGYDHPDIIYNIEKDKKDNRGLIVRAVKNYFKYNL